MTSPFRQEIIDHWNSFKNPLINDVLINLERIERNLAPISETEEQSIKQLLETCEKAKPDQVEAEALIKIFNQLPAAYMLYIIHKMQSLNAELTMKVIGYAQKQKNNHPEVMKFFQRNMMFEKSQLMGRIFSNSRMQLILDHL